MKPNSNILSQHLLVLALGVSLVGVSDNTRAATNRYWNAGSIGGDGNWGTNPGDKNWNTTAGALLGNTFWPDSIDDLAVFEDATGGTVTVFDQVQAAGIVQNGASYVINAGTITLVPDSESTHPFIDVQTGTLVIDSTLDGASGMIKQGNGNLVLSNINSYTGSTTLAAGMLTLTGSLGSTDVGISPGAVLSNSSGGLSERTVLSNSGAFAVNAAETIHTYISNGGMLESGTATLVTTTSSLGDHSAIAGRLFADTLTSNGAGYISGTADARHIHIASGILTNSGILGSASTRLDIASGATLVAGGTQRYALLTTSGSGPATWRGDLNNSATLAPGAMGGIGKLKIDGDFTNAADGILKLDISSLGNDQLLVAGTAKFGGSLDLTQLGTDSITPFVPVQVVTATRYDGAIGSLTENLEGAVWFNPQNGTVTRIASPVGNQNPLHGITGNQTSTWISLYDDVIDPALANITRTPGATPEYVISSGIADGGNPDLLWALSASLTPTGLNADLLDRLSPAVYTGFSDYAAQATRTHQRTALSAPPLAVRRVDESKSGLSSSSKGSAKDVNPPVPAGRDWEFFAATDFFNLETEDSRNHADYELSSLGVIAGARTQLHDRIQVAAYLAADDGSIDGRLIDSDGTGWSAGVICETPLDEKSRTILTAAVSYGRYNFDGSRVSAFATSAGWSPGRCGFLRRVQPVIRDSTRSGKRYLSDGGIPRDPLRRYPVCSDFEGGFFRIHHHHRRFSHRAGHCKGPSRRAVGRGGNSCRDRPDRTAHPLGTDRIQCRNRRGSLRHHRLLCQRQPSDARRSRRTVQ